MYIVVANLEFQRERLITIFATQSQTHKIGLSCFSKQMSGVNLREDFCAFAFLLHGCRVLKNL